MGLFKYFKDKKRASVLEQFPIPIELWEISVSNLPVLAKLDSHEQLRLRNLAAVFLNEKSFHPLQGAVIDKVLETRIAALACLPILNLDLDWYSDWKTIIVVPDSYEITRSDTDEAGVVHEYQDELGGEVLHLGPIVLSLKDVAESVYGDGYNVVIHEAAHKLDGKDGIFDGCPPLPPDIQYEEWRSAFTEAYDRTRMRRGPKKRRPRIDDYAAFSPDEFFAVCVESFFETPVVLRSDFPAVYALMTLFFKQDPFERLTR